MDVVDEVLDCIHLYRRQGCFERYGESLQGPLWAMMRLLVEHVCAHWQEADSGIWEVRGGPRHFVYSKVMAWVALDRALRMAQRYGLRGDTAYWTRNRDMLRAAILEQGFNRQVGAFVQSFGSSALDAANLLIPV